MFAAIIDTSAAGSFCKTVICHRKENSSVLSAFLTLELLQHVLIAAGLNIIQSLICTINDKWITPMEASQKAYYCTPKGVFVLHM